MPYPAALGHETVGTVIDTGSRVQHFSEGDRVLRAYAVYPDAQLGNVGSAWGGFAEYGKVTDWAGMRNPENPLWYQQTIPTDLSLERAVLLIPQKEVWSSLDKVGRIEGNDFLITGAGIVGLLFGDLLKKRGAGRVTIMARRQGPLDRALAIHAADDVSLFKEADQLPCTYDALIETTGSPDAANRAVPRVRPEGDICAYAVYGAGTDPEALRSLQTARRFQRIDPDEASAKEPIHEMARDGALAHETLVTHPFAIDNVVEAWHAVKAKRATKVLVCCNDSNRAGRIRGAGSSWANGARDIRTSCFF
jgi:threonine dehydrogenase-like Zn-dependent dehydrogenase